MHKQSSGEGRKQNSEIVTVRSQPTLSLMGRRRSNRLVFPLPPALDPAADNRLVPYLAPPVPTEERLAPPAVMLPPAHFSATHSSSMFSMRSCSHFMLRQLLSLGRSSVRFMNDHPFIAMFMIGLATECIKGARAANSTVVSTYNLTSFPNVTAQITCQNNKGNCTDFITGFKTTIDAYAEERYGAVLYNGSVVANSRKNDRFACNNNDKFPVFNYDVFLDIVGGTNSTVPEVIAAANDFVANLANLIFGLCGEDAAKDEGMSVVMVLSIAAITLLLLACAGKCVYNMCHRHREGHADEYARGEEGHEGERFAKAASRASAHGGYGT